MDSNNLIHPNIHGFRAGHSTTTGLIQMYDAWVEALDCNEYSGACFLDLSAAFDIVDHPLLLEKLGLYGFSENSINWVASYLGGRSQTVYIYRIIPVKNSPSTNRCSTRLYTWTPALYNIY
jgi:hypothetical protein